MQIIVWDQIRGIVTTVPSMFGCRFCAYQEKIRNKSQTVLRDMKYKNKVGQKNVIIKGSRFVVSSRMPAKGAVILNIAVRVGCNAQWLIRREKSLFQ